MTRSLQEVVPSFAVAKVYQIPNTNQIFPRKTSENMLQSCTHFPLNKTLTTMEKILRQQCNTPLSPSGSHPSPFPKPSMSLRLHPRPTPKAPPDPAPRYSKSEAKGRLKTQAKGSNHPTSPPGLTHEITIVRGQGRQGAYAEEHTLKIEVSIS